MAAFSTKGKCLVVTCQSLKEIYIKFIESKVPIELANVNNDVEIGKADIVKGATFGMKIYGKYYFCRVMEDMKFDELFCKVNIINTDVIMKYKYEDLKDVKLQFKDFDNLYAVKLYGFNVENLSKEKHNEISQKLIQKFCIADLRLDKPDPADGLYPVYLLDETTGDIIPELKEIKHLMEDPISIYERAKEEEIFQLFNKEDNSMKYREYRLSYPIMKKTPAYHKLENLSILSDKSNDSVKSIDESYKPYILPTVTSTDNWKESSSDDNKMTISTSVTSLLNQPVTTSSLNSVAVRNASTNLESNLVKYDQNISQMKENNVLLVNVNQPPPPLYVPYNMLPLHYFQQPVSSYSGFRAPVTSTLNQK